MGDWSKGDALTAGRLNGDATAIAGAASSAGLADGLGMLGIGRGRSLRGTRKRPILGLLSGSSSPYSFTQGIDLGTASLGGLPLVAAGPRTGTAYEVNGRAGLGGKTARLYPDRSGHYRFQWIPRGGGPSGTLCPDGYSPDPHCTCGLPCGWSYDAPPGTLHFTFGYGNFSYVVCDSYGHGVGLGTTPVVGVTLAMTLSRSRRYGQGLACTYCDDPIWSTPLWGLPFTVNPDGCGYSTDISIYYQWVFGCGPGLSVFVYADAGKTTRLGGGPCSLYGTEVPIVQCDPFMYVTDCGTVTE